MFVVQMYTVCSQELIRLETISEKGPGHELTSEYTLLSSGAKKRPQTVLIHLTNGNC